MLTFTNLRLANVSSSNTVTVMEVLGGGGLCAVLVFMIIAVFLSQSPGTASYSSAILCGHNVVNILMHQYLVFLLTDDTALLHASHLSLIS